MAYPDPYPSPAPDPFIRRWLFITVCIAALMLLWQFLPAIEAWFSPREAADRTVTARGDLAADEKATIELCEESRASVGVAHEKSPVEGNQRHSPLGRQRGGRSVTADSGKKWARGVATLMLAQAPTSVGVRCVLAWPDACASRRARDHPIPATTRHARSG